MQELRTKEASLLRTSTMIKNKMLAYVVLIESSRVCTLLF